MARYVYGNTLAAFTTARAGDVATELQAVEAASALEEVRVNDAIKFPAGEGNDIRISENPAQRAGKTLGFGVSGEIVLQTTLGSNRGDHADAAGTDYYVGDIVKDAAGSIGQNNIYQCTTAHTSSAGGLSADIANWTLLIEMAQVTGSQDVSFSATPDFDFDAGLTVVFGQVTAAITDMTTSNRAKGKGVDILFECDGTDHTIALNSNWVVIGTPPATLPAGKSAVLSLRCRGTAETDIVAMWGREF